MASGPTTTPCARGRSPCGATEDRNFAPTKRAMRPLRVAVALRGDRGLQFRSDSQVQLRAEAAVTFRGGRGATPPRAGRTTSSTWWRSPSGMTEDRNPSRSRTTVSISAWRSPCGTAEDRNDLYGLAGLVLLCTWPSLYGTTGGHNLVASDPSWSKLPSGGRPSGRPNHVLCIGACSARRRGRRTGPWPRCPRWSATSPRPAPGRCPRRGDSGA